MKIGLQIPTFAFPGGTPAFARTLADIARASDDAGFYSLWLIDHFFQMEAAGGPDAPMIEAYSGLSYFAALTRRVKLGTLVTGAVYRNPGVLAKLITTLDVLSGGRAYAGVGAAWYEREAVGLGIPFPAIGQRFEMLEETLQILRQMWADNTGAYNGKHYHLAETVNNPQPVNQPYPPILVGGMGEKKTLRLVADYADACNFDAGVGLDALRHKLNVLRGHCEAIGRDYDTIEKTVVTHAPEPANTGAVLKTCRDLGEAGFTHVIFNMPSVHERSLLEQWGREVIPVAAAVEVTG